MNYGYHFHLAPRDMGDLRMYQLEAMNKALRQMEQDARKAARG